MRRRVPVHDMKAPPVHVDELVRGVEASERVERHPQHDPQREAPPELDGGLLGGGEGVTEDVVHHGEHPVLFDPEVLNRHDVGVVDPRRHARLIEEHPQEFLFSEQVGVQHLEGRESFESAFGHRAREVHRRHAPRAEPEQDLVPTEALPPEGVGELRP